MSFINGLKITDVTEEKGYDLPALATSFANGVFHQIFTYGFFHGDLHPGNILVQADQKITLVDFGVAGRLTTQMKEHLASLIIGLKNRRTDSVLKSLLNMGIVHKDVEQKALYTDLDELRVRYYDKSLSEISLADTFHDLIAVAQKHRCEIPPDLVLLGKTLLSVERIVSQLAPELRIIDIVEPFGRQLLKEKYNPSKVANSLKEQAFHYLEWLQHFPEELRDLVSTLRKGNLKVEIGLPDVDQLLRKLDQISNRLSFSIVLLSFSIIMVGLIIASSMSGESTMIWQIPAIEIGFGVAIFMFLWILFSIFRSGRF